LTQIFNPAAPVVVEPPAIIREDSSRAEAVVQEVINLNRSSAEGQIAFANLMVEFIDGDYFHADHCHTLVDFYKKHGFELSPREIDYRVNVARKSAKAGITNEQRKKARLSKMKAICRLDPSAEIVDHETGEIVKTADIMRDLTDRAGNGLQLKELNEIVATLLGEEEKPEKFHETVKYTPEQRAIVDMALEVITLKAGDTVDPATKESKPISRPQAYTYLAAEVLNDPNYIEQVQKLQGNQGGFVDSSESEGV
jgi:hypothetical protein